MKIRMMETLIKIVKRSVEDVIDLNKATFVFQ